MSLPDDLLIQARLLATLDRRKPRQANLRRSVSSAYYALFHLLATEASLRVTPRSPALLAARVARTLTHGEMKKVCRSVSEGKLSVAFSELQTRPFTPQLRFIARKFVALQEARHEADYDLQKLHTRYDVLELLDDAEQSFSIWAGIRASDEATVFLAALLFAARWDR